MKIMIEQEVPYITPTHSFDPHPPRYGINRYNYVTSPNVAYLQLNFDNALITNFFASLHPNFEVPTHDEYVKNIHIHKLDTTQSWLIYWNFLGTKVFWVSNSNVNAQALTKAGTNNRIYMMRLCVYVTH